MSQDRHKFVKAPENLAIRSARPSGRAAGRPTGEFLWVDYKENQSKARDLVRSKQAFVRTRHHRLRREKQAQHNGSLPQCPSHPVASSSTSKSDSDEDDHERVVLTPSPQAGVTDGSPSLAISTNHNPNIYFHHYRIHSSRACFPLCSKDVTVWFWKKAVEDPTLMQIKLAISAAHRAAILSASGAPSLAVQKPAQDALRFRGETIKSLRYILQNTSTMCYEQTVFIISHIIVSEGLEANVDAANMHMDAVRQMINAAGGMDLLGHGTLSMLYSCEFLRGIMCSTVPKLDMCAKFQTRVLKESAFFKANNHFTISSTLGTRIFNSPWSQEIHPIFKSILSHFRQLVSYYESFNEVDVEPMSVENDCLLYLNYRLLSLPFECLLTPFEETLRLSVLTYCCVRIWNLFGVPCLGALLEQLRRSLFRSLYLFQSTAPDLLFWILFIGSLASRGMKTSSWFLAHLTDAAEQMGLKNWASAASILETFFFVCRRHDEPARELWNSNF